MEKANQAIIKRTMQLKENIEEIYKRLNELELEKRIVEDLFNKFKTSEGIEVNDCLNDFLNEQLDELVKFTEEHNVEIVDLGNLEFQIKNNTIYPEYLLMSLILDQNYEDVVEIISSKYNLTIPKALDISIGEIEPLKMNEAYYPYQMREMLTMVDNELKEFNSHFKIEMLESEIQAIINMIKVKRKINEFINIATSIRKLDEWMIEGGDNRETREI